MAIDEERRRMLVRALEEHRMDGIVCTLPENILMLTGYWPVVGTSILLASADGTTALIVPDDEVELAEEGWADAVHAFSAGSLASIVPTIDAIRPTFDNAAIRLGFRGARIGYEGKEGSTPAGYPEIHTFAAGIIGLLASALIMASPIDARRTLDALRSVKTPEEIEKIRQACAVAARAYEVGCAALRPGVSEMDAAVHFRIPLFDGTGRDSARRDGFIFCMSGPNGAEAYRAYQRSRGRRLTAGDTVLVHCNSYIGGYWTDITRTFFLGAPDDRARSMFDAVLAARGAALEAIRPSVPAAEVDRAAREVLIGRGFGDAFKHPTGHGVGFLAIDHNARPRIHPASDDLLEPGMVFNVEPGIYIEGYGGIRHCDMVVVTAEGYEILTPFQSDAEALFLTGRENGS